MATGHETESMTGELTGPAPAPAVTPSSAAREPSVRPGDCLGRYLKNLQNVAEHRKDT